MSTNPAKSSYGLFAEIVQYFTNVHILGLKYDLLMLMRNNY